MVTRKSAPAVPQQASLTVEQMRKGIARLERIIPEIEGFDSTKLMKRWSSEQKALEATIEGALTSVFGHNTVEYRRYARAKDLDHGHVMMYVGYGHHEEPDHVLARRFVAEGKVESVQLLRQAIRWLTDEIADAEPNIATPAAAAASSTNEPARVQNLKVFVVHGHDAGAKEAVARFLSKIDLEPIILHEQANKGRTIIEKIEAEGDVGFAVVILSPDDVGGKNGAAPRARARQNVLLELGYFYGRLGRHRVCALATSNDMELPTDFAGVVWEQLDEGGGWKQSLARELGAAGFDVDWNKVMR